MLTPGVSPMAFALNNPVSFNDPTGLASDTPIPKKPIKTGAEDFVPLPTDMAPVVDDLVETLPVETTKENTENSSNEDENFVGTTLVNKIYEEIGQGEASNWLNCSENYRCYPTVWNRVREAYINAADVKPSISVPAQLLKPFVNNFPPNNTPFELLFGSHHRSGNWKKIAAKYRGKGAPGAMAYIGYGKLVDDIWRGKLLEGAVLQIWENQEVFNSVFNGIDDYHIFGHSAIFVGYQKSSVGKIIGITIADQRGLQSISKDGNEKLIIFGANLLDYLLY